MKNKKQSIFLIIFIIILITILGFIFRKKTVVTPNENILVNNQEQNREESCYYRSYKTDRNFYDVFWLKVNVLENKITGEYRNLPAEKDSKVGTFEGNITSQDQITKNKQSFVMWNSFAEGMNVTEELFVDFGENNARIGFGESLDRGDGVYVFKDKTNLFLQTPMSKIDCDSLDEKLFVEKYTRENISDIATNNAVLGGTWYVLSVMINPLSHTGEILYEDGHIQSEATFIYNYEKNPQNVTVTKFEVKK